MIPIARVASAIALVVVCATHVHAQVDPGVRDGQSVGGGLPGLTPEEQALRAVSIGNGFANDELARLNNGFGPRFNGPTCNICHIQPALGGSSPASNPLPVVVDSFNALGGRNVLPSFITPNGPVREARFKLRASGAPDGEVHNLFVISGIVADGTDASGCNIVQPDFAGELARNNVAFRIPTPVFGLGLMEHIPETTLVQNLTANATRKAQLGITGRVNRNPNDGRVARFGWKAQNISGFIFAAEAFNVEQGVTTAVFQTERDETAGCQLARVPNHVTSIGPDLRPEALNAVESAAVFMTLSAPPQPSTDTPGGADSINRGRTTFSSIGCDQCHTPTLRTGDARVAALRFKDANLYSDLALHNMGPGLADDISQGVASGDEFRTAPLWGVGQRIFFLHDGRTSNLIDAILAHQSAGNTRYPASEANRVIANYTALSVSAKQDLLNFLRSL
jgi:CxxC motif-containing protein (DUF1111 family)